VKVVPKIYRVKVLKIIIMTVEKLSTNRIKNRVIVLQIKQKDKKMNYIISRESNPVSDNNEDLIEISMANNNQVAITDYQGTKDTHQHRTTQIKTSSTFNNNKKWECQVFMDLTKGGAVDHQNRRRRVKTISNP